MAHARADVLPGDYTFAEFPVAEFPAHLASLAGGALALVRDEAVWSALLPASTQTRAEDRYAVVCFHFAAGIPNSGFVGWLATEFKRELGTGVFVVCGHNAADGGVFDYWGIPRSVAWQGDSPCSRHAIRRERRRMTIWQIWRQAAKVRSSISNCQ